MNKLLGYRRDFLRDAKYSLYISDVHDQRIIAGTALCLKDSQDRSRVGRVRSQTVNRFRRKRHNTPSRNDRGCVTQSIDA
jgi:hypothetical protein